MLVLAGFAVYLPVYLHFPEQIRRAAIRFDGVFVENHRLVDESWFDRTDLVITARLAAGRTIGQGFYQILVYVKAIDGEWYQCQTDNYTIDGDQLRVKVPFGGEWRGKDSGRPWNNWCLHRIREVGIRVYGEVGFPLEKLEIVDVKVTGKPEVVPLTAEFIRVPESGVANSMMETDFILSREYDNPFDPTRIDLWFQVSTPSGKTEKVPAYFTQDYRRKRVGDREVLSAAGKPNWRARYTPTETGIYQWVIRGRGRYGDQLKTELRTFEAKPGNGSEERRGGEDCSSRWAAEH